MSNESPISNTLTIANESPTTETEITPEVFASHLCADLRLPERPFVKEIIKSINKAREDAESSGDYDGYLGDGGLGTAEENRKWFDERSCKKRRRPLMDGTIQEGALDLKEFSISDEAMSEELRITIKVSSFPPFRTALNPLTANVSAARYHSRLDATSRQARMGYQ